MADDGSSQSQNEWNIPKFYFVVTIGGIEISFQEVIGLEIETQAIEFRSGNSEAFSPIQMPGIEKYGNVTLKKGILKKGIFKNDTTFWLTYNKMKTNTPEKKAITINLLDEENKVTMSWTLINAYPIKMTGPDMNADGNEVTIDTIELAHEGLTISGS